MAHMIQEHDMGFVFGTTWHGLDQYKQLDRPVTADEALTVLDYPLEKRPNHILLNDEIVVNDGSFGIVRTDTPQEVVLVPNVGNGYVVLSNDIFFNSIQNSLLEPHADKVHIESVGTLANGQIAFVNIALNEFQITGDESPTKTKLAYFNPLGLGSYKAFCHSIRIVCQNTLKMAEAQGATNKTLRSFSHTKSAESRINTAVVDLANIIMGVEEHKAKLEVLASTQMKSDEINNFLMAVHDIKTMDKVTGKSLTRFNNKKDEILHILDTQEGFDPSIKHTRYAMLQAVTNFVDHSSLRKGNDEAYRSWDGLVGNGSRFKANALKLLSGQIPTSVQLVG